MLSAKLCIMHIFSNLLYQMCIWIFLDWMELLQCLPEWIFPRYEWSQLYQMLALLQ